MLAVYRAVAALAEDPEFHFAQRLEPGTIEWIHNPSIMHSRTAVVDGEVSSASVVPRISQIQTSTQLLNGSAGRSEDRCTDGEDDVTSVVEEQ